LQIEAALNSTSSYAGHMQNAWGEFLHACEYFGPYLVAGQISGAHPPASCFYNISTFRASFYNFLYTEPFKDAYSEYAKMFDHDVDHSTSQVTALRAIRMQYPLLNMNNQKTRYEDLRERDAITGTSEKVFTIQVFDVISQSLPSVVPDTVLNCAVGAAAVVVSLFFFLPPAVVATVVCCVAVIDFLLLGWLKLIGMTLNLASSVCMTMAIGFAIDYASDIAYAFHKSTGSGLARATEACRSMAKPIFVGGMSSLLAAGPILLTDTLAGKTFASMVIGTVLIGVGVGFIALPAALVTITGGLSTSDPITV